MMEEDHHDELRFVCKYCDKKYPSGKSLGGHMRSHVIAAAAAASAAAANSSESDEKFANLSTLMINGNNGNGNGNDPSGNGNSSSYGLRENPKKTWRAVVGGGGSSSTFPFPNEKICKQCGKGFQSLKALCGHMACHSEKDRGMKDYDHSWTSENLDHDDDDDDDDDDNKVVTDSQSDTDEPELQDPTRITRSKSKRYKKLIVKPYSFSLTNNNSNNSNYNYGSSSVTEIDEIEQEEVAMCLMMLSKDSANWAGFDFVVESSDNNSAVLETKSSSVDIKISKKSSLLDAESFQLENSNSGYSRNGIRKVESDIPVEELLRNGGDRNKNKSIWGRELSYEEKLEIRRNLFREFGYRDSLKKRIRDDDDSYNPELDKEATNNKKKNKYECLTCNKIFSSFQGLGGHRPCHKKNNLFASSKHENGENNLEREYGNSSRNPKYEKKIRVKKSKGHECPTCFRMFKSGQALGGHRRSHFINGSISHIAATENEGPSCSDMIDLNLPAPEED